MIFKETKAIALASFLLQLAKHGTLEYISLIKLLYLIERKRLENNESIIIFDHFVAMKMGPVLSNVYSLIRAEEWEESNWHNIFTIGDYKIRFNKNCKEEDREKYIKILTESEKETAENIWEEYKDYTWMELVEHTHLYCKEWKKVFEGKNISVATIEINDILEALGKTESEKQDIYYQLSSTLG